MSDRSELSAEASPEREARTLRDAASGALALRFPSRWLEEHTVLPLRMRDGVAEVAAEGTLSAVVSDVLARTLHARITVRAFAGADIRAALVANPRHEPKAGGGASLAALHGDSTESLDDLRALASREPVVQVVNALLTEAARSGASDVHIETTPDGLRVRMRRDGVLQDVQQLGVSFQAGVISRVKVLAALDIAERRLPQDGRARVRIDDRDIDIRVSTLPALHGESIVLRLLDSGREGRTLTDLGISPSIKTVWTQLVSRSSGLLLVTGPTGSGKTTTLYAALAARSTPGVKVVTVEDPVEYRLDGVVQLPVNPKAGFGFPNALRAILRHDTDVILVGEMRDAETAEIAVQAALTGHLVLSTLHTTDATGALARLTEMGIPAYLLAATLHGVLAQRLVRLTCDACGAWRPLTRGESALVHDIVPPLDPPITKVREGAGCERCAQSGYRGRAAIAELLVMDDVLRATFVSGASIDVLRGVARDRGATSLQHDGWCAVRDGRTTIAEVTRVVSEDDGL
ncbi:MAG: type II/IV secretion system protein [Gemmatimonadaceae bacterium]|nr:type II/IV secretion system protein [Gemmatimonadaceae bacterium]